MQFLRPSLVLLTTLLAPAALLADPAGDPLDHTSAYSLMVDDQGAVKDGYYYLGFVHGLPYQAVHAGFSGKQSTSQDRMFYRGEPFAKPAILGDNYGLVYYSLAWAGNSLAQTMEVGRQQKKDYRLGDINIGDLTTSADANDELRLKGRGQLNLFDPPTVAALTEYVKGHVKAWGADVPGLATGRHIRYWGLDNEWEGALDYSPQARQAFAKWLEKAYQGDIAGLNEAWNTRHATFEQAAMGKLPADKDFKTKPGAFLDLITFQSENFVTVLAGLAKAMNETDPLHRGVVHKSTQQTLEMPGVNRKHTFDHALFADLMRPYSAGIYGTDMYGHGDRQAYELNSLYNAIRPMDRAPGYGVLLAENNNHGGPGPQFAATQWRLLANGLKGVDFFTMGFAGAKNDWDKFGFLDPATGRPKDKLFYAARWAGQLHRAEKFWTDAVPAPGMPRIAMLMPRRDILLADLSDRNASRWAYPRNHRWMVYRWLREQGYWVDVIPSTKLTAEYLQDYQGLLLVGAEHLASPEVDAIKGFVTNGGVLIADTRAGYYDEHHRDRSQLDATLGVKLGAPVSGKLTFAGAKGDKFTAAGLVDVLANGATVFAKNAEDQAVAYLKTDGRGKALYFPFELGSLTPEVVGAAAEQFLAEGPTADVEEYAATQKEFAIGDWFAGQLRSVGLASAYFLVDPAPGALEKVRVEQPMVDALGNTAVIVGTRGQSDPSETVPASTLDLPLPGTGWTSALWAPADHDGLQKIEVKALDAGRYRVQLPEVKTAGVIYLFRDHAPLLGLPQIPAEARSADGWTAKLQPGQPTAVTVQVYNPGPNALANGALRLQALQGWTVAPSSVEVPAIAPGGMQEFAFTVTSETDQAKLRPDWLYPLVTTWSDGTEDRAIIAANVELALDPAKVLHVLTDNASYPATYPQRVETGATYTYSGGTSTDDPIKNGSGTVLKSGFGNQIGRRVSYETSKGHFAKFNSTRAEILFDLKKAYDVRKALVTLGPGSVRPSSIKVYTSEDGRAFAQKGDMVDNVSFNEFSIENLSGQTRYVRFEVVWPEAGGTLDEVEIWGLK